jgi:putative ABC transport system permease protein
MNDLRFALRQMRKSPGFTLVIVLSLAVGIGANAVVFTWIGATLLNAIPAAARPEQLAVLMPEHRTGGSSDTMSLLDIEALAAEGNVFSGITASQYGTVQVRLGRDYEWLWGQSTMANFFEVLGVRPALGRSFLPGEDRPGAADQVAVISHRFWQERFEGAASVLGKVIEINQRSVTIVGVAPPGFVGTMGGLRLDLWVPLGTQFAAAELQPRYLSRSNRWLHTVARLAPGVSHREADSAANAVSQWLAREFPETSKDTVLRVVRVWESKWGGQSLFLPLLRVLAVVAGLLLLLVIANVANLLLARAQTRQAEMGVRLALGASAKRVLRQLLTENLFLAAVGGACGVALAVLGANFLFDLMPPSYLPIGYDVRLNWKVLTLVAGLTLFAGTIVGLAPALQAARTNLNESLKAGARTSSGLGRRQWLRRTFVVGQVGLAFVLLLGMGLCVRSFGKARQMNLGLDPRGVWLAGFKLSPHVGSGRAVRSFFQTLQREANRLPGVESATLASWLPLGFEGGSSAGIHVPGYLPAPGENLSTRNSLITPGYFKTLRIPLIAGRDFSEADDIEAPRVGVVNEVFARRFFPGRDPVGLTFNTWVGDVRIIGVARTGKYRELNEPEQPFAYLSAWQVEARNLTLALRTAGDPRHLARAVEQLAASLDPAGTPTAALTYEDFVAAAFTTPRIAATLLSVLGVLALLLAVLGIYAVMAQNVGQRVRELGIRLALGAQPGDVRNLILRQGMIPVGTGLVMGGVAGLAVSRLLSSVLVGVTTTDIATWMIVPVLLFAAALITCWFPARRASHVDLIVALRTE